MEEVFNLIEEFRATQQLICKGTEKAENILAKVRHLLSQDHQQNRLGLCLLSCVVKSVDREIFEENALFWLKSILRVVNLVPSENLLGLCYETVKEILTKGRQIDKIFREIATKAMEPIIAVLLNDALPVIAVTYELVALCLQYYGNSCSKQRKRIELFILKGAVSRRRDIVNAACSAYPYLALCGSGGEHHSKHAEQWKGLFDVTVKTIFVNYKDLLSLNEKEPTSTTDLLPFPPCEKNNLCCDFFFLHLERSFQLLSCLMSRSMPFHVNLPFPLCVTLFTEISKLLTLDIAAYNFYSKVDIKLALINVVSKFLECMAIMFKQFSMLFAPYTIALSKIILDSISSCFVLDRTHSYCAFSNLVKYVSVSPTNCDMFNDFLDIILKDITRNITTTKQEVLPTKKTQKSKSNKSLHEVLYSKDIDKTTAGFMFRGRCELVEKNTKAALVCLLDVIHYVGPYLSTSMLKLLLSRIFTICKCLYGNESKIDKEYSSESRHLLFKTLHALFMLYHPIVQVPRNILLSIFQAGTRDPSDKVSSFCNQSLYNFDQVLHSANPVFRTDATLFAPNLDDTEDTEMVKVNEKQTVPTTDAVEDFSSMQNDTLLKNGNQIKQIQQLQQQHPQPQQQHLQHHLHQQQQQQLQQQQQHFQQQQQHLQQQQEIIRTVISEDDDTTVKNNITIPFVKPLSKSADHVLQHHQKTPLVNCQRRNSDPGKIEKINITKEITALSSNPLCTENVEVVDISDDEEQPCFAKKRGRDQLIDPNDIDFELNEKTTKVVCIDNEQPSCSRSTNNYNNNSSFTISQNGGTLDVKDDHEFQEIISTFQEVYSD